MKGCLGDSAVIGGMQSKEKETMEERMKKMMVI